ncbi:hypothetical protein A8709_11180 [Paenibacillus pectinilyticus]|uniref:Inosine/uridine-preferring nucleoside hydrolase domain-containing protein n=1 Tax=Paenibacillus pectinilyticus TaxID=512399 RepID=A0A1C1A2H0_9BACL|nr:nucleoside hydrolase [Paenibacillus pectinilyticus]OCT14735.1 hypothetical protein A8709_11180 [Paenibacillus pectinilyticus]
MNRIPVIIDTDPGIDDAHAILLALSSDRLDVLAITTVNGNMPIAVTTDNALKIIDLSGKEIPVAQGAARPLVRNNIEGSDMFHGETGLGHVVLPPSSRKLLAKDAVETLYDCAIEQSGKLHVIAMAPLTNIALLLRKHPDVVSHIAHITIMGGSEAEGNITPAAEFNFYVDPEAADVVMRSGIPMTLIDLEGCKRAVISKEDAASITEIPSRISTFISELFAYNFELYAQFGQADFVIHDSIAVATVIDPSILVSETCNVVIETEDESSVGASRVTFGADTEVSHIAISRDIDYSTYLGMIKTMMSFYRLEEDE